MYYGQFSNPKVDEYLHSRFFSDNPTGLTCVEAGAEEGSIIPSCKFFEESLGWKCINVEPNPLLFSKLQNNRPNSINVNYALVSPKLSNTEVQFQGYKVGLGYVIAETSAEHIKFTEQFAGHVHRKTEVCSVVGIDYNALIKSLKIDKVALLVLDTEGSEFNILQGLTAESVLPSVVCIEDNLYEQEKFTSLLSKLGYKFDQRVNVNIHYYL